MESVLFVVTPCVAVARAFVAGEGCRVQRASTSAWSRGALGHAIVATEAVNDQCFRGVGRFVLGGGVRSSGHVSALAGESGSVSSEPLEEAPQGG